MLLVLCLPVLCLPGPKPLVIALWTYCIIAFPIALKISKSDFCIKVFLVNVFANSFIVASKFKPSIVTRNFVYCSTFCLSVNILWTICIIPKTIHNWEFWMFIFCTVVLAVYPWCYAFIAMKEACGNQVDGVGKRTYYGTTKRGVVFFPTYRPIMILTYCMWDTAFTILWQGTISGLTHNVMAIITAVMLCKIEGKELADSMLFWITARACGLGCMITTWLLCRLCNPDYEDPIVLPNVDKDGFFMKILLTAVFTFMIVEVTDLANLYIIMKKTRGIYQ